VEAAVATKKKSIMNLLNRREQDLMLLAKHHYKVPDGMRRADVARQLIGLHNLYDPTCMPWRDAAAVIAHDLIGSGLVPLSPDKLATFLVDLGPYPVRLLGPDHEQPGGYYAALIDKICEAAAMVKVREGETYLLPWEMQVDQQVVAWLADMQPNSEGGG
jgi:hypothetical protein